MRVSVTPEAVATGVAQRLRAVRPLLHWDRSVDAWDDGDLLDVLVKSVMHRPSPRRVWLLWAAVSGCLPSAEELAGAVRLFRRAEPTLWLLAQAPEASRSRVAHLPVELVVGGVVVDVDHTGRSDLHTGVQQMVRGVMPCWWERPSVVPVVWSEHSQAMRTLVSVERERVLRWGTEGPRPSPSEEPVSLVVPWRSVVVVPEVPPPAAAARLAALAQYSGNAVVVVGHDCIPAVSADMLPTEDADKFAHFLTVVKHAKRVACVGATATAEFAGFASALVAQGLSPPWVGEVPEPVPASAGEPGSRPEGQEPGRPLVLCVGSFEPRKNHPAVLYAAERLWRDGLDFELWLVGGSGWGDLVPRTVARLQQRGRPLRLLRKAGAAELDAAYRRARFTVFPSLHEGFGLPVAESLAHGTPVVTSDFGSTAQTAAAGGAVVVDPYDDEALLGAMRRLLTDPGAVEALRAEIRCRPSRTWQDYAEELWEAAVAPELDRLARGG
jgi:glycosyltransferase involved in cell wall biosynthesis